MEKKQTAVEWIEQELEYIVSTEYINQIIQKAKEMEKEQSQAAFKAGWMRANATNYDPSYFEHFLSETYDNH